MRQSGGGDGLARQARAGEAKLQDAIAEGIKPCDLDGMFSFVQINRGGFLDCAVRSIIVNQRRGARAEALRARANQPCDSEMLARCDLFRHWIQIEKRSACLVLKYDGGTIAV
jgi:hypothetical protein